MWQHLQVIWKWFDTPWSPVIFWVTFSDSLFDMKLSMMSDTERVNYQHWVWHRAWSKPIRDLPSFCSWTLQAPQAGSCERAHPTSGHSQRAGRTRRLGLQPRTSARQHFQNALLSSSLPDLCPESPFSQSCLTLLQKSVTSKELMWGWPHGWIICIKRLPYQV